CPRAAWPAGDADAAARGQAAHHRSGNRNSAAHTAALTVLRLTKKPLVGLFVMRVLIGAPMLRRLGSLCGVPYARDSHRYRCAWRLAWQAHASEFKCTSTQTR